MKKKPGLFFGILLESFPSLAAMYIHWLEAKAGIHERKAEGLRQLAAYQRNQFTQDFPSIEQSH